MDQLENINPDVFNVSKARGYTSEDLDELHKDEVDAREVFGKLTTELRKRIKLRVFYIFRYFTRY